MVPEDALGKGEEAPTPADLAFLRRAFVLARAAKAAGNHPFGAVVVDESGRAVAEAGNNSHPPGGDPTQHAELAAAARAARVLSPADLAKATLYTSAEPCCMCAGAIYWCNIGRVVYALSEERLLELTGNHPENPTLALGCRRVFASGQHPVRVLGPLLEDEAAEVHLGFWG
jgi:tRNA(Arg) A34 adenosine deaminase TadA